ncbi:collagen alpha-1(II) chain-like [Dorcoceras hygrometricum]|uniref:Collagen alpha-1(II) chain-like n=1 Tax=Dorcoceras hygrometricum TaxID=472368 RepID=A0A2Z7ASB6_9LAMI|nr:collagen alpha-1(II) chain-like [Dorcoceras hygrometricum]
MVWSARVIIFALVSVFFLLNMKSCEGTRILDEEEEMWMLKGKNLLLQSLQGRTPSPNACTWIPGTSTGTCRFETINERNFAGRSPPPPSGAAEAYPSANMIQFGVASGDRK